MADAFDFATAETEPPEDPNLDEQNIEAAPVTDADPGTVTDTDITEEA